MSSPLSAQPLKVTASGSSSKGDQVGSRTPVASRGSSPRPRPPKPLTDPADISSPHELTAFVRSTPFLFFRPRHDRRKLQVETLLEQLDTKFDDMSSQIIERSALSCSPLSCGVSSYMAYGLIYMHAVMQMSQRVDALEGSIQDIINGDAPTSSTSSIPSSPSTTPTTLQSRRTRNGLQ
jgi:heat shock factor-binding protein 1